jgi:hypothetical protein
MGYLIAFLAGAALIGYFSKNPKTAPPVPDWVRAFIVYYATEKAMTPAGEGHAAREIAGLLAGGLTYRQKLDLMTIFDAYVEVTGAPFGKTDASFAKLYEWVPKVLRFELAGFDSPPAIDSIMANHSEGWSKKPFSERNAFTQLLCRDIRAGHHDTIQMRDTLLQVGLERSFVRLHKTNFDEFNQRILNHLLSASSVSPQI